MKRYLLVCALLLTGCVTPATGHDSYSDKAVTSVRAATSEVQTARLVLQLLSRHRILSPYVDNDFVSPQEMNQSLVGVTTRLLTETKGTVGRYAVHQHVNLASWDPKLVGKLLKGISLGLVGVLAWLCRTRYERRDDPRLLGDNGP